MAIVPIIVTIIIIVVSIMLRSGRTIMVGMALGLVATSISAPPPPNGALHPPAVMASRPSATRSGVLPTTNPFDDDWTKPPSTNPFDDDDDDLDLFTNDDDDLAYLKRIPMPDFLAPVAAARPVLAPADADALALVVASPLVPDLLTLDLDELQALVTTTTNDSGRAAPRKLAQVIEAHLRQHRDAILEYLSGCVFPEAQDIARQEQDVVADPVQALIAEMAARGDDLVVMISTLLAEFVEQGRFLSWFRSLESVEASGLLPDRNHDLLNLEPELVAFLITEELERYNAVADMAMVGQHLSDYAVVQSVRLDKYGSVPAEVIRALSRYQRLSVLIVGILNDVNYFDFSPSTNAKSD